MIIRTRCKKCGVTIKLDFGGLTRDEALAVAEKMDRTPRECPGQHVELSGWNRMWDIPAAIHRAFDLGEGDEPTPVLSDRKYVERLMTEGKTIIDGGRNTVPELLLPAIHEYAGLIHMGFGNFRSETHLFLRMDSPKGSRFYERIALEDSKPVRIPA